MNNVLFEKKLNVDGNRIAVLKINPKIFLDSFINEKRVDLVSSFKNEIDTVMLVQEQISAHCVAFEPNHGEKGAITTVCGNGLKAVASVLGDSSLQTRAGNFKVENIQNETQVFCGSFIASRKMTEKFTGQKNLNIEIEIEKIIPDVKNSFQIISFGSNVTSSKFAGEPHLVLFSLEDLSQIQLKKLARKIAPVVRKSGLFNCEVNITFASLQMHTPKKSNIFACTFERHLGDDPSFAITGSCGTGGMAATNVFAKFLLAKKLQTLNCEVSFPKGKVLVSIQNGKTILVGRRDYENI